MTDFGPEYSKIQTAFKRDDKNIIIPGEWTLPEFEYLQDNDWLWTEKVNGTNIRLHWDGEDVTIGGRTDDAMLPARLVAWLRPYTSPELWKAIFSSGDATVYGEGYGGGVQQGKAYGSEPALIVFDVKVGPWWLKDADVQDVAFKLNLDTVPEVGRFTLNQAWDIVKGEKIGTFTSHWIGVKPEGLVGRPAVDLTDREGERLLVKMKLKDWEDYQRRQAKS